MSTEDIVNEDIQDKLINKNMRSTTIDSAMLIVARDAKRSPDDWKFKGLGLQLSLLGLAEIQALRVSQLAGMVYNLEKEVFKDKNLREMEPKKIVEMYQMATRALTESANYVKSTIDTVKWADIETQLIALSGKEGISNTTHDTDISGVADKLLQHITQLSKDRNKSTNNDQG